LDNSYICFKQFFMLGLKSLTRTLLFVIISLVFIENSICLGQKDGKNENVIETNSREIFSEFFIEFCLDLKFRNQRITLSDNCIHRFNSDKFRYVFIDYIDDYHGFSNEVRIGKENFEWVKENFNVFFYHISSDDGKIYQYNFKNKNSKWYLECIEIIEIKTIESKLELSYIDLIYKYFFNPKFAFNNSTESIQVNTFFPNEEDRFRKSKSIYFKEYDVFNIQENSSYKSENYSPRDYNFYSFDNLNIKNPKKEFKIYNGYGGGWDSKFFRYTKNKWYFYKHEYGGC
jgi:hypothetical protein